MNDRVRNSHKVVLKTWSDANIVVAVVVVGLVARRTTDRQPIDIT